MGSSVVETTGKKKLSGTAKGYLILFGLVVLSWLIFKISRTLSTGMFISSAISSGVGSLPSSCSSCLEVRIRRLMVSTI